MRLLPPSATDAVACGALPAIALGAQVAALGQALVALALAPRVWCPGMLPATACAVLVAGETRRALSTGFSYYPLTVWGLDAGGWPVDAGFLVAVALVFAVASRRAEATPGSWVTAAIGSCAVGLIGATLALRAVVVWEVDGFSGDYSRVSAGIELRLTGMLVIFVASALLPAASIVSGVLQARRRWRDTHVGWSTYADFDGPT